MALPSTMHQFQLDITDVDRGVYEAVELRAARHPSESVPFLVTRILAFALEYREGLAFGRGVSTPDEPALWVVGPGSGATPLWSIRLAKSRSSSDTLGGYPVASGSWANCSTSGEGREPTRIGGRLSSLDRSVPLHALGALPGRVARARPRDRARRRVLAPVGGQYNLKATASDVGDRGVQPLACQTNEDR